MPRSVPSPRRGLFLLATVVGVACLAAGCSSSPSKGASAKTHPHEQRTGQSSTSTTGVFGTTPSNSTPTSNTASTTITVAGVVVQITGSSAQIDFTTPAVTGAPTGTAAAFADGGKTLTFTVTGVTYSGGVVTDAGPPTNQIQKVVVQSAANGVAVTVTLNRAATHYSFKNASDQVTVTVS